MKYKVTVLIEVEANSYSEAMDEAESILTSALNLLHDEIEFELVTAEKDQEDG